MAAGKEEFFKQALVGDAGVGKSSALLLFARGVYTTGKFISTIGADFLARTIDEGGNKTQLQIWDTAGQERFRALATAHCKGADGVFIVFDVTNRTSFENVRKWFEEVEILATLTQPFAITLIGSKIDLVNERVVFDPEARELAKSLGAEYVSISSKENVRIEDAFLSNVRQIRRKRNPEPAVASSSVQSSAPAKTGLLSRFKKDKSPASQSIKEQKAAAKAVQKTKKADALADSMIDEMKSAAMTVHTEAERIEAINKLISKNSAMSLATQAELRLFQANNAAIIGDMDAAKKYLDFTFTHGSKNIKLNARGLLIDHPVLATEFMKKNLRLFKSKYDSDGFAKRDDGSIVPIAEIQAELVEEMDDFIKKNATLMSREMQAGFRLLQGRAAEKAFGEKDGMVSKAGDCFTYAYNYGDERARAYARLKTVNASTPSSSAAASSSSGHSPLPAAGPRATHSATPVPVSLVPSVAVGHHSPAPSSSSAAAVVRPSVQAAAAPMVAPSRHSPLPVRDLVTPSAPALLSSTQDPDLARAIAESRRTAEEDARRLLENQQQEQRVYDVLNAERPVQTPVWLQSPAARLAAQSALSSSTQPSAEPAPMPQPSNIPSSSWTERVTTPPASPVREASPVASSSTSAAEDKEARDEEFKDWMEKNHPKAANAFRDAVTIEITLDPVSLHGQTFDGESIRLLINDQTKTGLNPLSRKPFTAEDIFPNALATDMLEIYRGKFDKFKAKEATNVEKLDASRSGSSSPDSHSL